VSSPDRLEYRAVDSSVNPYLSCAAIIKAMEDGIQRNLDPGPPENRNIYEAIAGGKNVKRVPMTLGDALAELEKDAVIRDALPGEMYTVFHHYKTDEWERYCATVSDWDVAEYLDVLP
jgi:glutamine synthetase